ncbi:MAG: hypothetical protein IB618_03430 [Candidatus Pacearchaeota archaeon]|nr:MAG: hypothetical protein IB618_03430 [Candidatus Pacearchaeota archaeon]
MIKNKKAGVFAIGLVLGMIIFIGMSWHAFSTTNKNINAGVIKTTASINIKNMGDRLSFYINESSKLAASQAFYEIVKDSAIDKDNPSCTVTGDTIIWNSNCMPEKIFLQNKFTDEYGKSFFDSLKAYSETNLTDITYTHTFENGEIKTKTDPKTFSSEEKGTFATYKLEYEFNPSITLILEEENINLDSFDFIYIKTNSDIRECRDEEAVDMVLCVKNKLEFDGWTVDVKKQGSYLIFELETEEYFFFEDKGMKFEKIILKFAMII